MQSHEDIRDNMMKIINLINNYESKYIDAGLSILIGAIGAFIIHLIIRNSFLESWVFNTLNYKFYLFVVFTMTALWIKIILEPKESIEIPAKVIFSIITIWMISFAINFKTNYISNIIHSVSKNGSSELQLNGILNNDELIELLKHRDLKSVNRLVLDGIEIDEILITALKDFPGTFRHVKIAPRQITDHNFYVVLDLLRSLKPSHIDVSHNKIGDDRMRRLLRGLKDHPVYSLNLSHTKITTDSIRALMYFIKTMTSLDALNLSSNHIRTSGEVKLLNHKSYVKLIFGNNSPTQSIEILFILGLIVSAVMLFNAIRSGDIFVLILSLITGYPCLINCIYWY